MLLEPQQRAPLTRHMNTCINVPAILEPRQGTFSSLVHLRRYFRQVTVSTFVHPRWHFRLGTGEYFGALN